MLVKLRKCLKSKIISTVAKLGFNNLMKKKFIKE